MITAIPVTDKLQLARFLSGVGITVVALHRPSDRCCSFLLIALHPGTGPVTGLLRPAACPSGQ